VSDIEGLFFTMLCGAGGLVIGNLLAEFLFHRRRRD
jgi:hypothetical protein